MKTVKGWGAFSTFISPKISRFLKNNLSPGVGGASSQKLYLKNGTVENVLNPRDVFPRVKLAKISRLFDNNSSPGVGVFPVQSPYLKNDAVENFSNGAGCTPRESAANSHQRRPWHLKTTVTLLGNSPILYSMGIPKARIRVWWAGVSIYYNLFGCFTIDALQFGSLLS
jgi:hypothetical protein